ncbi:MAG: DNA-processing protein DprA [Patescibacteria group bacterium]
MPLIAKEQSYWIAFSQLKNIGPIRLQRIISFFPDLETAWLANTIDLQTAGLEEKIAQEIIIARGQLDPAAELEKIQKAGISFVTIKDPAYPRLLKEIYGPPPLLYYRGQLSYLNSPTLAVVGARKYSAYGQEATEEIITPLARQKITIVSGLALGIDALAHEACLNANGQTVAVLGSGLSWQNIYPSANHRLAQKIIDSGGALISEYDPETQPARHTFPLRNRIIAGLSLATLVIEAGESSGSLITARHALENNRDVFAVPGSVFSDRSIGTNNLIKKGAKLIASAEDILEELNLQSAKELSTVPSTEEISDQEQIVLQYLSQEPLHVDKIAIYSKIKINVLSSLLMMLEIKGLAKDLGGNNYISKK